MIRYSHLLKNFAQCAVIHTVKGFSIVNKAEVDVFLESKVVKKKKYIYIYKWGFPGGSVVKNPSANAGDTGLIPGSGTSLGKGNGNPTRESLCSNKDPV